MTAAVQPDRPELSIVMPVYHEVTVVGTVVTDWTEKMRELGIDYEFLIYDADSSDGTLEILEELGQRRPEIRVNVCPRLPHGPSIYRGYKEARAAWVFQIDSDNEMRPESFATLWENRNEYDFLLGCREGRQSPLARKIVTFVSRSAVRLLFGKGIWDVNSPYRLIRRSALQRMLLAIPEDTIAPNVLLSGLAVKWDLRVFQCWVPHHSRRVGTAPLTKLSLWKMAAKAFMQTVSAAFRKQPEG